MFVAHILDVRMNQVENVVSCPKTKEKQLVITQLSNDILSSSEKHPFVRHRCCEGCDDS